MNFRVILHVLGLVTMFEGIFLAVPCVTALCYGEKEGWAYLAVALGCLLVGRLVSLGRLKNKAIYAKEGFAAVALSWIMLSLIGAIPFVATGEIPYYIDALFEFISGFTTTGSSILSDVEALSHASLIWRSFSHWFGGMGILVFVMAIMPMTNGRNIHLMRAESPGPTVEKLVPKIKHSASILYVTYLFLTIVQIILLTAGELNLFESINISFATAGTGGFSILNSGFATYSSYTQYVTAVFMILFGINFNVYFLLLLRKFKAAFCFEEMLHYLLIIAGASVLITYNTRHFFPTLEETFRHALFQVSSLITTTGFASTNFDLWPSFSKTVLLAVMFIGACAGSTGGGIKVSRIGIFLKGVRSELTHTCHPNSVHGIKYNNGPVTPDLLRSVYSYLAAYFMIFAISFLLVSLDPFDGYQKFNQFETNFTAVTTALNNVGPGFAGVGPTCNFGFYSTFTKLVLMFDMLAGRLELFPMLLLCSPHFWSGEKSYFHKRRK